MATYMCKLAFSNEIVKNIMDIDKSSLGVVKGWFTCYKIPKCSQLGFSQSSIEKKAWQVFFLSNLFIPCVFGRFVTERKQK